MATEDIVVVTSCTATKLSASTPDQQWTAESLYAGQQHVRLMRGVKSYRSRKAPAGRLRLHILSAGHGLIPAGRRVGTYDTTFRGLPRRVLRQRAAELGIPDALERLLGRPFRLGLLLLGDDYMEAAGLHDRLALGGPVLALCGPRTSLSLPPLEGLRAHSLSNADARRFGCGLISLKGELAGRTLAAFGESPDLANTIANRDFDLADWWASLPPTTTAINSAQG